MQPTNKVTLYFPLHRDNTQSVLQNSVNSNPALKQVFVEASDFVEQNAVTNAIQFRRGHNLIYCCHVSILFDIM
jgi:hypothetical protein